jgi:hypothetical protein
MSKFYEDDTNLALQKRDERLKAAKAQNKIPVLAEYAILHLQEIAKNGLPDCYKSFDEFLYDFYPDFSWNPDESSKEIQAVLNDPRFKEVVPILKKDWNIDMKEELEKAIVQIEG